MPIDRFMIAPTGLNSGLQTDVRPWLIADDAYADLLNCFQFRGRIRKRFGSFLLNGGVDDSVTQLYSRLRFQVGTTDGAGNVAGIVPGTVFKVGQLFSIGDEIFTVYQTGAPAIMLTTGASTVHTYDTTNGAFVITGAAPLTAIFFYPAEPVMGLLTNQLPAINDEQLIAFDTQFSYLYDGTSWERITGAFSIWTGDNSQFFWGSNSRGIAASTQIFLVTNFNAADGIRYLTAGAGPWALLQPAYLPGPGDFHIITARCIVVFKGRVVLLNTIETVNGVQTAYVNRARYSQNGDPLDVNAWREDIPGRGDAIDAPTSEGITNAQTLRDRLIVFFEQSTWELVYTGNEINPFYWQKINSTLGVESTFSVVPFDKVLLGIGNVGIHACNGVNVERIDEKIPNTVFDIHDADQGVLRVYGIRDYFLELVYWTFPSSEDAVFPNRILVYNYRSGNWALNIDTITCFGYYQPVNSLTWATADFAWMATDLIWSSGVQQAKHRNIIAGNQNGYTFIISADQNATRNSPANQITQITYDSIAEIAILTIINHNYTDEDYIIVEEAQGVTGLNDTIYNVLKVVDANNIWISVPALTGTYTGGGTTAIVSGISIYTKQYNFYLEQGRNAFVSKIDFHVDSTTNGQVQVDFYTSSSELNLQFEGSQTGALLGTSVLETSPYVLVPYEQTMERLWHPVYFQAEGEFIQLHIGLNDTQMRNTFIAFSDFQLHAMTFYATPTASRLQ